VYLSSVVAAGGDFTGDPLERGRRSKFVAPSRARAPHPQHSASLARWCPAPSNWIEESPMRVHHLNCTTMCPIGGRAMDGITEPFHLRGRLVCHCLLVETDRGLVLVDTGFGLACVRHSRERLSRFFSAQTKPDLREETTAIRQIEARGFDPSDVRHIVMTHLDFDHAGGLDDFPQATVHMFAREKAFAAARDTWLDRQRFRPQQWSGKDRWRTYEPSGEPFFGFESIRELEGLPPEILLVPLLGHTMGHCGVAVRADGGWLLHAGDAYFFHAELDPERRRCPTGLRLYQSVMEKDRRARLENQRRLRELRRDHASEVTIFCAHDVHEFEALSGEAHSLRADAPPQRAHALRPSFAH
jgi:glyoxylase-like metal-dependent hydrolase (beta-lactamase superfamily II)